MSNLVPIFIIYFISYYLFRIIELYVHRSERKMLIEKLGAMEYQMNGKFIDDFLASMNKNHANYSSLKMGLLLVGCGLGFIIGSVCSAPFTETLIKNVQQYGFFNLLPMIWIASTVVFGGVGLIVSTIIESKLKKRDCNKE